MKGDAVVGAVVENAKFKLVYRVMDPDTAGEISEAEGSVFVVKIKLTKSGRFRIILLSIKKRSACRIVRSLSMVSVSILSVLALRSSSSTI